MAVYRYLLGDVLTNTIYLELPLYGVFLSRRLNKAGQCTFTIGLNNEGIRNADIIDYTVPGKTALWVERDGSLIWGGLVLSRTYQAQAQILSYTGQTFEAYLYKQWLEATFTRTNVDQRQILYDLITTMQAKTSANIGLQMLNSWDPLTAIVRSPTFDWTQNWSFGKAIDNLIGYADGFDYRIDVAYDTNGNPQKYVNVDNKLGASIDVTQISFDYPGNIKNYYYPESIADAVSTMIGFGGNITIGDQDDPNATQLTLTSKYTVPGILSQGYPDYQDSFTNSDVVVQATLDSQTKAAAMQADLPKIIPTFEANPQLEPFPGSFNLGDYARFHIEDPRFPDGKDIYTRIIGWDIKPPSADSAEEFKLVSSGEES